MYQQASIPVADPAVFGSVRQAIDTSFAPTQAGEYLRSLERQGLRIRDFESALEHGLLGRETAAAYARLAPSDQGQIREQYLAALEQVAPELRKRFFRVYAYY